MTKKEKAAEVEQRLTKIYPEAICSLEYSTPYELLMATRLSAQCTDARVNIVCRVLFKKYPNLEAFAGAKLEDVEAIVKPTGFYHAKAQNLIDIAKMLLFDYDGVVPDSMEELLKLPGIGRKTANLVLGDIYGQPSYVCDTHCIRITNRLGLTTTKDPAKTEEELRKILNPKTSGAFCHRMVLFGRDTCTARSPKCDLCPLQDLCKEYKTLSKKTTKPNKKG